MGAWTKIGKSNVKCHEGHVQVQGGDLTIANNEIYFAGTCLDRELIIVHPLATIRLKARLKCGKGVWGWSAKSLVSNDAVACLRGTCLACMANCFTFYLSIFFCLSLIHPSSFVLPRIYCPSAADSTRVPPLPLFPIWKTQLIYKLSTLLLRNQTHSFHSPK